MMQGIKRLLSMGEWDYTLVGQNVTTALPPARHMAVRTCTRLSSHSMTSATCHAVGWLTGQESGVSAMCTHIAATDMMRGSA